MQTLMDMTREELQAAFKERGLPAFRARQVEEWLLKGASFEEMTNLPKSLRDTLEKEFALGGCRIEFKTGLPGWGAIGVRETYNPTMKNGDITVWPEDVGELVWFLCSEGAQRINGDGIRLDRGAVLI